MASGDIVGHLMGVSVPAADPAPLERLNIPTPTDDAGIYAWAFDDGTTGEIMDFHYRLVNYAATTGLTFKLVWSGEANTNDVRWGIAVMAMADDASTADIDTADFAAFVDIGTDADAPSAIGEPSYDDVVLTDAQIDGANDGDYIIVRLRRTQATANMTGDAFLWIPPLVEET